MWKLDKIQILVSINVFIGKQPHFFFFLHIVYGSFHMTTAKLNGCDRDRIAHRDLLSGSL